ncbi:hypothetical protein [Nocardiopsis lambiniae]|uniref:Protein kinase domain-containing protein n=1 Tax=Nocardiopsis lambiniae TaxID=3075539 RepID=A0ABU2M2I9_9ACTN|nr:hypothetical protein [Nocardiopsis sp. DSM 44743]MDT0326865.1 hypothetical protein [Nocardiopsis sp. DSM 44743]
MSITMSLNGKDVEKTDLVLGEELGSGGQGRVRRIVGGPHTGAVYKEYLLPGADPVALERLVRLPHRLGDSERARLHAMTCWPLARVVSSGHLTGFLMQEIPQRFLGRIKGGTSTLQELKYLVYEPKPLWGDIRPPETDGRWELSRRFVSLFQLLHSRRIVVGDVSMANLLWARVPEGGHEVFMIDCDGVRGSGERPVLPQAETEEWDDPEQPDTGPDLDTDRYKLALLVGRVLSRHKSVRPGEPLNLPPDLPSKVAEQVERRFTEAARGRGHRPDAHQWGVALGGRAEIPVAKIVPSRTIDLPEARLRPSLGVERKWIPLKKEGVDPTV